MSCRRMGKPQRGHEGAVPGAVAATASTLLWSAANICGRYSISTSRSSNKKRGGLSAKTGRTGGVSDSGRGRFCSGMASPSSGLVERDGGMGGAAGCVRAPIGRY